MINRVPLMHWQVWAKVHHHCLGPDGQGSGEDVIGLHRLLQMHQHLAGVVVRRHQLGLVPGLGHSSPAAAVKGLHKERIAHFVRDRG